LLNTYQVVGGVKIFNPSCLIMEGEGTAQPTSLANTQVSIAALTGHNSFGFNSSNNIYFNKGTTANGGIFAFSNSATRTYTLKDASGTLAFTSDIPANPVGGTGTTNYLPKFTGASTIGNSNIINDASGNLGLGVTPSAWAGISGKIFELGFSGGSAAFFQNGADDFWTASNAYFNAGWKYTKNGTATAKLISTGEHYWYNAPSGTAGNAISFTQAMTLKSNGNLLVGTTTDNGARLQVSGSATITGSTNQQLVLDFTTASGGFTWQSFRLNGNNRYRIFGNTDNSFTLYSDILSSNVLSIASTGAATFSSNQNATSTYTIQNTDTTNTSSRLKLDLISGNSALSIVSIHNDHNYIASVTGKDLYFQQSFGGTTNMIIKSSGNVGIGTTSPSYTLEVNSGAAQYLNARFYSSSHSMLMIESTTAVRQALIVHKTPTREWSTGLDTNGNFIWYDNTAAAYRMQITTGGNVLIGTTTDNGQKLQVNGTSYFSSDLLIGTTSNSPSSNVGIKTYADGRIYCVSSSSANTSESYSMYSTGAANYRFYVGWGGTIYATSTSISGISDISLKTNIRDLDKGLQDILQLKPRRFDWKNGDGKDNIGFVAQEIESIFPELISEYKYNQFETKKSLKMGDLIPSLVKAIQELKQEIDTLKK
jgi:hypothetical protein